MQLIILIIIVILWSSSIKIVGISFLPCVQLSTLEPSFLSRAKKSKIFTIFSLSLFSFSMTGCKILGDLEKRGLGDGEMTQWLKALALTGDPTSTWELETILNSGEPVTSSGLSGHERHVWCTYVHAGKTCIHIQKINLFIKIKDEGFIWINSSGYWKVEGWLTLSVWPPGRAVLQGQFDGWRLSITGCVRKGECEEEDGAHARGERKTAACRRGEHFGWTQFPNSLFSWELSPSVRPTLIFPNAGHLNPLPYALTVEGYMSSAPILTSEQEAFGNVSQWGCRQTSSKP